MKKTLAITLVIIMALSALMVFPSSAEDAIPKENILFSEDTYKDATDLSKYFKTVNGLTDANLPTVSFNKTTGRLQVKTVKNTILAVTGENDALKNISGSWTATADLYIVENNFTGNFAMMGFGFNNGNKWSTGYYAQCNVYKDQGNKCLIGLGDYNIDCTKTYGAGNVSNVTEFSDNAGLSTKKFTVKFEVNDTHVKWYIDGMEGTDGVSYTSLKALMNIKEGTPFLMLRENCTFEIDNLMVYKTPEAATTAATTEAATTKAATTKAATTKAADTDAPEAETTTVAEDEGGCGSVIAMSVVLPVLAVAGVATTKRRSRRK